MGKVAGKRFIAAVLAAFLVFSMFPGDAIAKDNDTTSGTEQGNTEGTELNAQDSAQETQGGEGEDNALPVTLNDEPGTYGVILDLNGGTINGLVNNGWTKDDTSESKWARTAAEGEEITLSEPYRAGYAFKEWSVVSGEEETTKTDSTFIIAADTQITAVWEEASYKVSFTGGGTGQPEPLWEVSVPYGAALWTGDEALLKEDLGSIDESEWTKDEADESIATATATIRFDATTEYSNIEVTRYTQDRTEKPDYAEYYYSFTIEGTKYFTYGGVMPEKSGYHFTAWKMTSGGSGFTVTEDDTVFTAQYQAGESYTFYVYYQYADKTRVDGLETFSKTFVENDISEGRTFTFEVPVSALTHYTAEFSSDEDGITIDKSQTEAAYKVTVDVAKVFGDDEGSSSNHYHSLTVVYNPATITYTVEYYQQRVAPEGGYTGTNDYAKVGELTNQTGAYNSVVPIEDKPTLGDSVSFDGFMVADRSLAAIQGGVLLDDTVVAEDADTATIQIYYDRAYYYIYTLTDTTEITQDPVKVQYGAVIPTMEEAGANLTRKGYNFEGYKWYRLDGNGDLTPYEGATDADGTLPANATMPAYDLYAVAQWEKATTSLQILYWVEARNASSYQNAYSYSLDNVPTEAEIIVGLNGTPTLTDTGTTIAGLDTAIEDGFEAMIEARYGDASYADYFSYNETETRQSPGNVETAGKKPENSISEEDGESQIDGDSYKIEVAGDGTTIVNVYYDRNLYTLEFVIGNGNGNVATETGNPNGTLHSNWERLGTNITFGGFDASIEETDAPAGTSYGDMSVNKLYHIAEAVNRDSRSAVGRYGTKQIGAATYYVYTITARFEADISMLWPTTNVIGKGDGGNYSYVSMGPDMDSYYRNVFTDGISQHNILGAYSTMDSTVTMCQLDSGGYGSLNDNNRDGTITHQLVAYWNNGGNFDYYFLYEILDTTRDPSTVPEFDIDKANYTNNGEYDGNVTEGYSDGDLVSYNGKIYKFTTTRTVQPSTNKCSGQNQPAKQGFENAGKEYYQKGGAGDNQEGVDADAVTRRNIYFFYNRETYSLNISNVNGNYVPSDELLAHTFNNLTYYEEGASTPTTGDKSLAELGWENIDENGTVTVRYQAALSVLNEEIVKDWLTGGADNSSPLEYPLESMGENNYYFDGWYRNQAQTIPFDWTANDMLRITGNVTVYAGYFTPRYTTSYALNGGSWTAGINNTIMSATVTGEDGQPTQILLYYNHQTLDGRTSIYWYEVTNSDDRLYVDELYTGTLQEVMDQGKDGHWHLKETMTSIEELKGVTTETEEIHLLTDVYTCYMQYINGASDTSLSHQYYVTITEEVGSVLQEPKDPIRNGYDFAGWYWFEEIDTAASEESKVYLKDVLGSNQSLSSYRRGYVYLNSVDDPYLLYEDENGDLYYYENQTGYRFNYSNQASLVDQDRVLYAAWKSTSDTSAVIYHLVEKAELDGITGMTAKDETKVTIDDSTAKITINGTEYVILDEEALDNLYTGTTQELSAKEYYTDSKSETWLPTLAEQNLIISDQTQDGQKDADGSITADDGGQTYRLQNDDGTYTYYAYFIYEHSQEVAYTVYTIDLRLAVAEGALDSYSDIFDRDAVIDSNAKYLIQAPQTATWKLGEGGIDSAVVTVNAPQINGYTVYKDWTQQLQLQSQEGTNQIFFYYVDDGTIIHYDVTYYLMTEGKYTSDNAVKITGIPAVTGEVIGINDMLAEYGNLANLAEEMSGYADSANEGQKELYKRYQGMTISYKGKEFTVAADKQDTLEIEEIKALTEDYALDSWSPSGDTLVLSNGAAIDVYLQNARIIINKVDAAGNPLNDAEFTLERLMKVPDGGNLPEGAVTVEYDGVQYYVDSAFGKDGKVTETSDAAGQVIFYDLSAKEDTYLYRLTETRAPEGYGQLYEPVILKAPYTDGDGIHYALTYTVQNTGVTWLPKAGVFGGVYRQLLLGGGALMMAVVLLNQRSRRRTREAQSCKRRRRHF